MKSEEGRQLKAGVLAAVLFFLLPVLCSFLIRLNGDRQFNLVYIPKVMDQENGFWTSLIAGMQLGAEEEEVNLAIRGPASEDDVESQIRMLEACLEEKPDAVLISANDYSGLDDVLTKVKEAGIPIVLVDSLVKADVARSIVATDNDEAGKILGEYASGLITDRSAIGIIGHVKDSSTAMEREKGIEAGLGDDADRIRQIRYCNSSFDRAYQLTVQMIREYPDIDILIGTNEYAAVGTARAIKDMGLAGQIHVLGFDSSLEETQLLEEAIFDCIVIQKPFNMGYLGIEQAVKILKKKKVEASINSGCSLITRDNMYEDENQKLLYPFVERK